MREESLVKQVDVILELVSGRRFEAVDDVLLQVAYDLGLRCAVLWCRILKQAVDLAPLL